MPKRFGNLIKRFGNLMKSEASPSGSGHRARSEIAEKITLEAARLAWMARASDFPFLAQLIDMVVAEAWREATEPQAGESGDTVRESRPCK
jgi:hypothetical protein